MTIQVEYPYRIDGRGRTALTDEADHIRDMIEQVLLTSPGERVNRPTFGCGLLRLVFEPTSPELAATLQFTIRAALQQWLGDLIEPTAVEVVSEDSTLRVAVQYLIRRTGEQRIDTFVRGTGP